MAAVLNRLYWILATVDDLRVVSSVIFEDIPWLDHTNYSTPSHLTKLIQKQREILHKQKCTTTTKQPNLSPHFKGRHPAQCAPSMSFQRIVVCKNKAPWIQLLLQKKTQQHNSNHKINKVATINAIPSIEDDETSYSFIVNSQGCHSI